MLHDSVSVIIPTYNRNIIVLDTLEHFNNQSIILCPIKYFIRLFKK